MGLSNQGSLQGSLEGIYKGSIRGVLGLHKGSWDLILRVVIRETILIFSLQPQLRCLLVTIFTKSPLSKVEV